MRAKARARDLRTSLGKGQGPGSRGQDPDLKARTRGQEPGGKAHRSESKDQGI